jgi:hypothetical protein
MNFYPNFSHIWADLDENEYKRFPYNSAEQLRGSWKSMQWQVTLHLVTLRKIFPCFLHFSLTWLEFGKEIVSKNVSRDREMCENWSKRNDTLPTEVSEFQPLLYNFYSPYSYSTTNKMHLFLRLFILAKRCTCFGGLSVHHQELKTAHTATGICQTAGTNCC